MTDAPRWSYVEEIRVDLDQARSVQTFVHHRQPSRVADWLREAGFTVEAQHLLIESVR